LSPDFFQLILSLDKDSRMNATNFFSAQFNFIDDIFLRCSTFATFFPGAHLITLLIRRPFGMHPFYTKTNPTEFSETRAKTTIPRKKRRDAAWYVGGRSPDNR